MYRLKELNIVVSCHIGLITPIYQAYKKEQPKPCMASFKEFCEKHSYKPIILQIIDL